MAVVYGLGYRSLVSGEWPKVTRARGTVQAINGQRLLLALEGRDWLQRIDLERIQTLVLTGSPSLEPTDREGTLTDGIQAVDDSSGRGPMGVAQGDSLQLDNGEERPSYLEERMRALGGGEHAVARISTKVVSGTLMCVGFSAFGFAAAMIASDPSTGSAHFNGIGALWFGLSAGSAIGFPLGVSWFDPHDSWPMILLAGVVPALAGYSMVEQNPGIGFLLMYFGPPVTSIMASELWRQPPEDRRVSLGLTPAFNGDLFASATLRF